MGIPSDLNSLRESRFREISDFAALVKDGLLACIYGWECFQFMQPLPEQFGALVALKKAGLGQVLDRAAGHGGERMVS